MIKKSVPVKNFSIILLTFQKVFDLNLSPDIKILWQMKKTLSPEQIFLYLHFILQEIMVE